MQTYISDPLIANNTEFIDELKLRSILALLEDELALASIALAKAKDECDPASTLPNVISTIQLYLPGLTIGVNKMLTVVTHCPDSSNPNYEITISFDVNYSNKSATTFPKQYKFKK